MLENAHIRFVSMYVYLDLEGHRQVCTIRFSGPCEKEAVAPMPQIVGADSSKYCGDLVFL